PPYHLDAELIDEFEVLNHSGDQRVLYSGALAVEPYGVADHLETVLQRRHGIFQRGKIKSGAAHGFSPAKPRYCKFASIAASRRAASCRCSRHWALSRCILSAKASPSSSCTCAPT